MAGIYIHIPFCKQACFYCNFHFSTSLQYTNEFVQSLVKEIELKKKKLNSSPISTLYFGGGTPSILSKIEFKEVINKLNNSVDLSQLIEFTIEVNPDDITKEKLDFWLENGVNRLSIGTQSFRESDLKLMNRAHGGIEAFNSIQLAQEAGFSNISIDLIYGIPGLNNTNWIENLERAVSLNIPHISSYCLTVEEKTALAHLIKTQKIQIPDEELASEQFLIMIDYLEKHGIHQYEISNFSKIGMESKHNKSYWSGEIYHGLGPGAHSFNGENRYWNISNNQQYFKSIEQGIIPEEIETLSLENKFNEYIMTSLRTREGIEMKRMEKLFSSDIISAFEKNINKWVNSGKIIKLENQYILSKEGRFFADGIASDLFI
ncbi:MAG: radical SAM family heme chaperone HemW [Bacteroidia bacterium]